MLSYLESEAKRKGNDVNNKEYESVVSWFANKGYKILPSNKDTGMLKDINHRGLLEGFL